ncbi:MAG: hypothetical protein WCT05_14270 [Lentisphaeria bacterium]
MQSKLSRLGLFLFLSVSVFGLEFTDYDSGRELSWDKLYPQGRIFPYSGFSPADVASNREAGFTLAGPSYGKGIEKLQEDCLASGIPFIYSLQPTVDGQLITMELLNSKEYQPDWAKIREAVTLQVKAAAEKYPQLAWWNIRPEELRYWRVKEYQYLQEVYQAIRTADPQKRPVWMYIPNHYSLEALKKYTAHMDIVGKGMYVNYSNQCLNRIWVRWSSENQISALAGNTLGKFSICVPEMFQDPPDGKRERIEARVRHDVYLALANGCRGVVIYSLAKRKNFSPEAHQTYFAAYKRIAKELTGETGLGQIFLFGERRQDLEGRVAPGSAMLTIQPIPGQQQEFSYTAAYMAEFLYRKARYLVLVNSAETETGYDLSGIPSDTILIDVFSAQPVPVNAEGTLHLTLSPLEVRMLKLEPRQ